MKFIVIFNLERLFGKYYVLIIGALLVFSYIYANGFESFDIDDFSLSIGSSQRISSNIEYLIYTYFSLISFIGIIYIVHNVRVICYDQILLRLRIKNFYLSQMITVFIFIVLLIGFKYVISCLSYSSLGINIYLHEIFYLFVTEVVFMFFISSLFLLLYTFFGNVSMIFLLSYYVVFLNREIYISKFLSVQFYQNGVGIALLSFFGFINVVLMYIYCDFLHNNLIEKENFYEHN